MRDPILEELRRIRHEMYLERQRDPVGFEIRERKRREEWEARPPLTQAERDELEDAILPRVMRMIRQRKRAERAALAKEVAEKAAATQQSDTPA